VLDATMDIKNMSVKAGAGPAWPPDRRPQAALVERLELALWKNLNERFSTPATGRSRTQAGIASEEESAPS